MASDQAAVMVESIQYIESVLVVNIVLAAKQKRKGRPSSVIVIAPPRTTLIAPGAAWSILLRLLLGMENVCVPPTPRPPLLPVNLPPRLHRRPLR